MILSNCCLTLTILSASQGSQFQKFTCTVWKSTSFYLLKPIPYWIQQMPLVPGLSEQQLNQNLPRAFFLLQILVLSSFYSILISWLNSHLLRQFLHPSSSCLSFCGSPLVPQILQWAEFCSQFLWRSGMYQFCFDLAWDWSYECFSVGEEEGHLLKKMPGCLSLAAVLLYS